MTRKRLIQSLCDIFLSSSTDSFKEKIAKLIIYDEYPETLVDITTYIRNSNLYDSDDSRVDVESIKQAADKFEEYWDKESENCELDYYEEIDKFCDDYFVDWHTRKLSEPS